MEYVTLRGTKYDGLCGSCFIASRRQPLVKGLCPIHGKHHRSHSVPDYLLKGPPPWSIRKKIHVFKGGVETTIPDGKLDEIVFAAISSKAQRSKREIIKRTGLPDRDFNAGIKKLLSEGFIIRIGKKKGTRYLRSLK
jgi:hypothetical protein